ncbi:hypothetical protein TSUD_302840 [Trifolium subterraneum]|uniref:Uncharacterized protein n=1 Tax=Trifolium subterraneum TaxID=3900 RepID=A0A2Z6NVD0_TRISU|nr:hypothetical protein TSUD_302840 [Trifolium subterraneum]
MTDIDFYVQDVNGDTTGMAFRMAYYAAKYHSKNNKEFCTYVGSMLCSVVPGFRNSVEAALKEICVKPRFVSLPSQANETNIAISKVPQLGWPSILVVFGYCILLLFKLSFHNDEGYCYNNSVSHRIRELKAKVTWDPSNTLDIPFDATKSKAVSTMLGSRDLRVTVLTFLMNNSNHPDSQIRNTELRNYADAFAAVLSHSFS